MTAEPALRLFFPENDLALARDLDRYTAPPAAVKLHRSGEALPLWYGNDGDRFVSTGINAAWLDGIKETFGMDIDVFDYRPELYRPSPWGWSKAARTLFRNLGYAPDSLPDDESLRTLRELSHRRTAARAAALLRERTGIGTPAVELRSVAEMADFLLSQPRAIVKLPWSSSGRGMVAVDADTFEAQKGMVEGMIHRQGSVMAEPHYRKALDFAMLFTMDGGHCRPAGLSVFETSGLGIYTGNILASHDELRRIICGHTGDEAFNAVAGALPPVLETIIGPLYDGPLGVDMLADDDGTFVPVVEINLRMTMGHVCARFYERYVAAGVRGTFAVGTDRLPDTPSITAGRLTSGTLNLTPPGTDFHFSATLP